MGLRDWWKSREDRKNKERLEWAENAQQDSADEIAHADIDDVRMNVGTSNMSGMSIDDAKHID
jgi:hypothetical protein